MRNKVSKAPEKRKVTICASCFQEVGKGKKHLCFRSKTSTNISQLVNVLPKNQQQQIASKLLTEYTQTDNNSNVALTTLGRPLRLTVNPPPRKEPKFSFENHNQYQMATCSSSNNMELITNFIRTCTGKRSISPNFREKLRSNSKTLEDCYKSTECKFDVSGSDKKQKRTVVYANAERLLEAVIAHRELKGSPKIKVMADGGQGFFKICLSVFPEDSKTNEKVKRPRGQSVQRI